MQVSDLAVQRFSPSTQILSFRQYLHVKGLGLADTGGRGGEGEKKEGEGRRRERLFVLLIYCFLTLKKVIEISL